MVREVEARHEKVTDLVAAVQQRNGISPDAPYPTTVSAPLTSPSTENAHQPAAADKTPATSDPETATLSKTDRGVHADSPKTQSIATSTSSTTTLTTSSSRHSKRNLAPDSTSDYGKMKAVAHINPEVRSPEYRPVSPEYRPGDGSPLPPGYSPPGDYHTYTGDFCPSPDNTNEMTIEIHLPTTSTLMNEGDQLTKKSPTTERLPVAAPRGNAEDTSDNSEWHQLQQKVDQWLTEPWHNIQIDFQKISKRVQKRLAELHIITTVTTDSVLMRLQKVTPITCVMVGQLLCPSRMVNLELRTIIHASEKYLTETELQKLDGLELLLGTMDNSYNARFQCYATLRVRYPPTIKKRLTRRRLHAIFHQMPILHDPQREESSLINEYGRSQATMTNAMRLAAQTLSTSKIRRAVVSIKDSLTNAEKRLGKFLAEITFIQEPTTYESISKNGLQARSTAARLMANQMNHLFQGAIQRPQGWGHTEDE